MASSSELAALTAQIGALSAQVTQLLGRVSALERSSHTAKAAATIATAATAAVPKRSGKRSKPPVRIAITTTATLPSLAQTLSTEGKSDRFQMTCVVPDALAGHVVGHQGRGLKQIADISGARVTAFVLKGGPTDQRHVSIRGSDTQVGEALVVLGKRLARQRVRTPRPKKQGKTGESGKAPGKPIPHEQLPAWLSETQRPPPSSPTSTSSSSTLPAPSGSTGPLHRSGFSTAAVSAFSASTQPASSTPVASASLAAPQTAPSAESARAAVAICSSSGRGRHRAHK
jgi:hypothetical protein